MKKPLCSRWKISAALVLSCVFLCANSVLAQQRYFAISLVNENDNPHLEQIRGAHDVGCNAAALTIQWGAIHGKISRIMKQERGNGYNVWQQYDDQIATARSLGMKIALNIAINTGDDVTSAASDRFGIDTGDGWKKEDRVVAMNENGEEAVFQKYGGPIRPGIHLQCVMTSLAAQSTKDRLVSFTNEVINRYKYLQDQGSLLYVNLIYTRQGEAEFETGTTKYHYEQYLDMGTALTDYSKPMKDGFRNWLIGKYGNINALNAAWQKGYGSFGEVMPKRPSGSNTFSGPDGSDWFAYRTEVLKETHNLFKNTVKGAHGGIKVITHQGSVYDKLARGRGTFPFDKIGADLDGIKINDDIYYDHRFALDLIRTNLPNRIYVNEAAYVEGIYSVTRLAQESFAHGANVVTVFYMERALADPGAVAALKNLTNEWVKDKQVTVPNPSQGTSFSLSNMNAVDGCNTNRDNYGNDCEAYRNWRNVYDQTGGSPVRITINDDVTPTGCFYKDLKPSQNGDQAKTIVPDNVYYHLTDSNCRIIGTVRGNGLTDGVNKFTASVQIDNQVNNYQNQPYVQRNVHFTPGNTNPNNTSVTLYASQQEFEAFNAKSSVKLPVNAGDSENYKSKLRIMQRSGPTLGLTGMIDPNDSDIQWDSVLGMWKITFTANTLSSFYITTDKAGPLPVKLVDFSVAKQENQAQLQWKTVEESNSDHFEIQHSNDGKAWAAVGSVKAAAESKVTKNYEFRHASPLAGVNLYRLKMVDQDSTFAYSKIVSASFEGKGNFMAVYPNPVTEGVFHLPFEGAVPNVFMTDLNGRQIPVSSRQIGNELEIKPSAGFSTGLYILHLKNGSKNENIKVMMLK